MAFVIRKQGFGRGEGDPPAQFTAVIVLARYCGKNNTFLPRIDFAPSFRSNKTCFFSG